MPPSPSRLVVLLAAFIAAVPALSFAEHNPERFQMNRDIRVEPNDKTGDVTCLNCSVYIRGEVAGDIFAMNGKVVVEPGAQVTGDIATLIGDVRLDDGAKIGGDVAAIGGSVRRSPQATVAGDVNAMAGGGWVLLALLVPLLVLIGFIALIIWLIRRIRRPDPLPGTAQRA
jgi:hypothetical protein